MPAFSTFFCFVLVFFGIFGIFGVFLGIFFATKKINIRVALCFLLQISGRHKIRFKRQLPLGHQKPKKPCFSFQPCRQPHIADSGDISLTKICRYTTPLHGLVLLDLTSGRSRKLTSDCVECRGVWCSGCFVFGAQAPRRQTKLQSFL